MRRLAQMTKAFFLQMRQLGHLMGKLRDNDLRQEAGAEQRACSDQELAQHMAPLVAVLIGLLFAPATTPKHEAWGGAGGQVSKAQELSAQEFAARAQALRQGAPRSAIRTISWDDTAETIGATRYAALPLEKGPDVPGPYLLRRSLRIQNETPLRADHSIYQWRLTEQSQSRFQSRRRGNPWASDDRVMVPPVYGERSRRSGNVWGGAAAVPNDGSNDKTSSLKGIENWPHALDRRQTQPLPALPRSRRRPGFAAYGFGASRHDGSYSYPVERQEPLGLQAPPAVERAETGGLQFGGYPPRDEEKTTVAPRPDHGFGRHQKGRAPSASDRSALERTGRQPWSSWPAQSAAPYSGFATVPVPAPVPMPLMPPPPEPPKPY